MRIRHEPASSAARTLLNRLRTNIRGYIVRGLLVIVPLGITFYVLRLCYLLTAGHLAPFVRANVVQFPPFMEPIIAVILFSSMLYLIGFLAAWVLGRRLIAIGEMLLRRIPLVKTIYTASKQAVDVLSLQDADPTYQSAVLVDFPYPGSKAMAFMTGKVALEGEGPHYRIFVPTTPNPTSGYFCIFPPRHVEPMGMGVQDAFKAIMSVGIVTPDILTPSTPLADTELRMPSTHEAADHRPAKGPVSVLGRVKHLLRTRMLSGFLVLVPLGITAFAMNLLYTFTAGRIAPLAKALPGSLPGYVTAIISVMLFFVLLYTVGYIATAVVGGRLIRITETIIERIPIVTTIYSASKQMVEAILSRKSGPNLKVAVFVHFPYPGVRTIGFIVGTIGTLDGRVYYKVFLPTTPNISVGLLQFYEARDVFACTLTVEEAIKMAVSGGIIGPDHMTFTRLDQMSSEALANLLTSTQAEV